MTFLYTPFVKFLLKETSPKLDSTGSLKLSSNRRGEERRGDGTRGEERSFGEVRFVEVR